MQDLDFSNKRVLIRVDFNVPLYSTGEVTDDTRIKRALKTIDHVLQDGGSVILMSHLGRPLSKLKDDGMINVEAFTLKHVLARLSELLNREVLFASDCGGPVSQELAAALKPGQVLLLENTRFYPGEKKGDPEFARALAQLADIYLNDAFGTAHRAHASTTTVAQYFESGNKAFGFLMQEELDNGQKILHGDDHPFVAIIGGAKVSDKIALIDNLLDRADHICIGGGMAYTFHKALGFEIGRSLCEDEKLDLALAILKKAETKDCQIHLPMDAIVAEEFSATAAVETTIDQNIPSNMMGLDIGPKSISAFSEVISSAATIIWNGPMGVFEFDTCAKGTYAIAQAVATATDKGGYSLIGGGDSVAAINKSGLQDQVSFISTGGGAMLELLEGKTLPGVAAIQEPA